MSVIADKAALLQGFHVYSRDLGFVKPLCECWATPGESQRTVVALGATLRWLLQGDQDKCVSLSPSPTLGTAGSSPPLLHAATAAMDGILCLKYLIAGNSIPFSEPLLPSSMGINWSISS